MKEWFLSQFGAVIVSQMLLAVPVAGQERQQQAGPDTVVLESRRGKVTLTHKKHAEQTQCSSCHHESKPEKPLAKPQQKCGECHTTQPAEPMKTSLRTAFHDTANNQGTCITCHIKAAETGKAAPVECSGCHKREG
jgi:hypothetical protein